MSSNEKKLVSGLVQNLKKSGFNIEEAGSNDKGIDFLATNDKCVFAVQVKQEPFESFDIISGSTISYGAIKHLEKTSDYKSKEIVPVLVSGSVITSSSQEFGKELGVIVTGYSKAIDNIKNACKRQKP